MGRAALGKGIKDLLPKTAAIPEEPKEADPEGAIKELETNIERYLAQGFDVSPLNELKGSDRGRILEAIEAFRDNVKKLNSAMTLLRSLEGYGFNSEIESIMLDIRNTLKADDVLRRVNRLKERMPTEAPVERKQRDTPRTRVLKELKVASENMGRPQEAPQNPLDFKTTDVDGLMEDLADLGSAFNGEPPQEDEVSRRLAEWEMEGFFLDKMREDLSENSDPISELARFEKEVERMRGLRKRLDALDPQGIEEQVQKVRIKIPYTYMATDVEHDIEELEAIKSPPKGKEGEAEPAGTPLETVEAEVGQAPPAPEGAPEPPVPEPEEPAASRSPPEEAPAAPPVKEAENKEPPLPLVSVELLLDKAKDAYGAGDLEGALSLFQQVLAKDPDNSKARFMIRRIGQKR